MEESSITWSSATIRISEAKEFNWGTQKMVWEFQITDGEVDGVLQSVYRNGSPDWSEHMDITPNNVPEDILEEAQSQLEVDLCE